MKKKYILLNHFNELTELTFNAKLEFVKMVGTNIGSEKNVYKQYLEVFDNFFVFLPVEILSEITLIYISLVNKVLDKDIEQKGIEKKKVSVTIKNIKNLQQVPFSDSVLFRNEVEIMKKIQTMKDRKVKSFV